MLVTNQITTQFKSDFTSMKKIDFKTNVTDDSMDDVSSGGESFCTSRIVFKFFKISFPRNNY